MSKFFFVFHTNLTSKHKCEKNHEGASVGMGVAGAFVTQSILVMGTTKLTKWWL
jgi:hypothetical protein